jgi:serine/threonine-protein kinase HipA
MSDGKFCYIIKRFDRLEDGTKLQKETMFQILGAEDKYRGSLEQVGRVIRTHATNVGLDSIDFFERVLLCFLLGNGDMHLKNWAMLTPLEGSLIFAPCYDLISSKLYLAEEADSALALNGKRDKLSRADFEALGAYLKIDSKPTAHVFQKLLKAREQILVLCDSSQLSTFLREKFAHLIHLRYQRLYT